MSATDDGIAGFLPTSGFGEMLRLGLPTILLGSLPARVNAEANCVAKVLRFICNLRLPFDHNAFDRGAKHWFSLYEHNGRWFWGTIFFFWWYWFYKGKSVCQPNQIHPLIGYTERSCQDSRSWPSVPNRIFRLCWCILLLQNLTVLVHSTTAKLEPTITQLFVVKPFQQMCPRIVIHWTNHVHVFFKSTVLMPSTFLSFVEKETVNNSRCTYPNKVFEFPLVNLSR